MKDTAVNSEFPKIDASTLSGQSIALAGEFCSMSKSEIKIVIARAGGRICQGPKSAPSILVKGIKARDAVLRNFSRLGVTIITERQFIEIVGAVDLIESLCEEARDSSTAEDRLFRLALVVPEAAILNPIWKNLYERNPEFAADFPGDFKLELLKLLDSKGWQEVTSLLAGINLGIDIFTVDSVVFCSKRRVRLSHSFKTGSCLFTLNCNDLDADMEDVGGGCEDRLPLAVALASYWLEPFAALQDIANEQGLFYEPSISPRNGYPMHPVTVEMQYGDRLYQWDWDDIPVDEQTCCQIILKDNGLFGLNATRKSFINGPIFTNEPIFDDSQAAEGVLSVEWDSECFVPVQDSAEDCQVFEKVRISECFEFNGHGLSDFTEIYRYRTPFDLEAEIKRLLDKRSVGRILTPVLNKILLAES